MDEPASGFPSGTRVISHCPVSACGWQHEEPPPSFEGAEGLTVEDLAADATRRHFAALEEVVKAHLETHSPLEWVQEVRRLGGSLDGQRAESRRLAVEAARARRELQDAVLIAAVLVRKAGGSVAVSDADLAAWDGTLVREPSMDGFTLEVHPR
jgi:hypothetical protein